MYDMYPDWGPTSQSLPSWAVQPEPRGLDAVQQSLDLRDNGGLRPDDN